MQWAFNAQIYLKVSTSRMFVPRLYEKLPLFGTGNRKRRGCPASFTELRAAGLQPEKLQERKRCTKSWFTE